MKLSSVAIYGKGRCACGPGPYEFVLLGVKNREATLYYCPHCGSAWDRVNAVDTEDPRPLSEVAPEGVRWPTATEIQREQAVDITFSGFAPVIAEIVEK